MEEISYHLWKLMHDTIWNTSIGSIMILSICTILLMIENALSREARRIAEAPELIVNFLKQKLDDYPYTMKRLPAAQKRVKVHNIIVYTAYALMSIAYVVFWASAFCMIAICSPQLMPELFKWLVHIFSAIPL